MALALSACTNLPADTPARSASPLPQASSTPTPIAPHPVRPVVGMPSGADGYPWWHDTVFYQIFLRSFYDSNGDGIGDIAGLIAKLDYLNDGNPDTTTDLGVTGLWLLPIHPAASYHGYDVTDYYAVNPEYGTLDDFKRLMAEAHKRGIRIIIDLVLNHTSREHPWFVASQDPQSPYRDWYVWSETDPGQTGWHASPSGGYYYGFFWEGMPDLNYTNPAVTTEMEKIVRFWMQDAGVDGFRLDAAKYLIEEGTLVQNSESTHAWYRQFRPFYKGINPQALTIGEVWDLASIAAGYSQGDEFDMAFDFDLSGAIITGLRVGRAADVSNALSINAEVFEPGQFASFLTNHDMNRVMSQLAAHVEKAKLGAVLLLTAPGVPFIYYGEELGMLGKKPDEDIRTPMQWSAEANGGFTTGTPWRSVNPDSDQRNVAAQSADPDSILSLYRALIGLRNGHAALRVGDLELVETGHPAVFAALRMTHDEEVLVVVNLDTNEVSDYGLSLIAGALPGGVYRAVSMLDGAPGDAPQELKPLTVSAQGGFTAYQPLPALTPLQPLVLQLQPSE